MGPDKMARMNLNEKPKAKPVGKGKKKGKQAEESTVDTSNLDSEALIKINPLKIADLERILNESSKSGILIPAVDELMLEPLA